ncbi:hypothetical protein H310_14618 [Aphanomyces invadans]|uniref:Uncharacterized protein n=1 Tax=Aphanomyces invadans TaxID=157072 RepID=A0A024TAM0_9STRA|nr:hypothetical protein H310_14618 [Aphanomyces invadans]ETV90666.1 hypothetical protein H310_14618 [Aphanomyces invadans]|eukprot:XP_008880736.1 hypothetical protein H310_14618 [Aphanomyces invadans]
MAEPKSELEAPTVDEVQCNDACIMKIVDLPIVDLYTPFPASLPTKDVANSPVPLTAQPTAVENASALPSPPPSSVVPAIATTIESSRPTQQALPTHSPNRGDSGKFYNVDLTPSTASAPLVALTFRDRMRRWIQRALVSTGQATPSTDDYFVQQKDRFLGLLHHLEAVKSSLQRHRTVLSQFAASASQLGLDVGYSNGVHDEHLTNGSQ